MADPVPPPQGSSWDRPRAPVLPWLLLVVVLVAAAVVAARWFAHSPTTPSRHPEAEAFLAAQEPRLTLLDGFRSSDTEATVRSALDAGGLQAQQSVSERPPSARYPPRRQTRFTVVGYRHLGSEGTLLLDFFNDRLMEADFQPDDPVPYAAHLHRRYPQLARDRNGYSEAVQGPLRIWTNVDLARSKVGRTLGKAGRVIWQDHRLVAQRDDWDARFGYIPPPAPE